jgi:hypothetical protein
MLQAECELRTQRVETPIYDMTLYQLLVLGDCECGAESPSALSSLLLVTAASHNCPTPQPPNPKPPTAS